MRQSFIEKIVSSPKAPRLAIALLLIVVIIDLVMPFLEKEIVYEIRVMPSNTNVLRKNEIADYTNVGISTAGKLRIKNPTFPDRLLFRTDTTSSFSTSLVYLIILLVLFKDSKSLQFANKDWFREKNWKPIITIGTVLLVFSFVTMIKDPIIASRVTKYTKGQYRIDERFTYWVPFWAGMLLINFGIAFKKASTLQQEQDLTV